MTQEDGTVPFQGSGENKDAATPLSPWEVTQTKEAESRTSSLAFLAPFQDLDFLETMNALNASDQKIPEYYHHLDTELRVLRARSNYSEFESVLADGAGVVAGNEYGTAQQLGADLRKIWEMAQVLPAEDESSPEAYRNINQLLKEYEAGSLEVTRRALERLGIRLPKNDFVAVFMKEKIDQFIKEVIQNLLATDAFWVGDAETIGKKLEFLDYSGASRLRITDDVRKKVAVKRTLVSVLRGQKVFKDEEQGIAELQKFFKEQSFQHVDEDPKIRENPDFLRRLFEYAKALEK